ncbi:carbamoyltransferase [Nocardia sp. NPDC059177]|uniref:carbamoyltransferase family protein n=1 Tax=Nocardia sp. NPDC059177 TaxID=3346759 RepID=UPI003697FFE9
MIVLGYNGFTRGSEVLLSSTSEIDRYVTIGHDAGAAVIIDGTVVAAVEEERLNREKKTHNFPINAINWCLERAGIKIEDVDYFALPWAFTEDTMRLMNNDIADHSPDAQFSAAAVAALNGLYHNILCRTQVVEEFRTHTGFDVPDEKFVQVPHHLAHLMCGYQVRGGGDSAFLISDGRAERDSSISGTIEGGVIRIFDDLTANGANSVGVFYSLVTRYLGFYPNNDEYKVMGLSAYCPTPTADHIIDSFVTLLDGGQFKFAAPVNGPTSHLTYSQMLDATFATAGIDRKSLEFQASVARLAQDIVERVTAHQISALSEQTDLSDLIFEGGVALNCVNNTKLLDSSTFSSMDVSYGASDSGLPIGAAAFVGRTYGDIEPTPCGTYTGPEFTPADIRNAVADFEERITATEINENALASTVAELLTEKVVIGWFQGAAEFGPRALGSRSILANPTFKDIKDIINIRVKHRETFRPFAPIVLESGAGTLFEMGKLPNSPYMTFVVPVREEFMDVIPSACHVDNTSRVQTVSDGQNPLMADLLREVEKRVGVACLLNTSFNVAGEPIVGSPWDAINCFLGTEIDYLVLGNLIIKKAAESV